MYFSVILMIAGTVIVGLGVLGQIASSWVGLHKMDIIRKESLHEIPSPAELAIYMELQRVLSEWLRVFTAVIVFGAFTIIVSTKV